MGCSVGLWLPVSATLSRCNNPPKKQPVIPNPDLESARSWHDVRQELQFKIALLRPKDSESGFRMTVDFGVFIFDAIAKNRQHSNLQNSRKCCILHKKSAMTVNIQAKKLRLIQRIAALDNEQTLSDIEAQLNSADDVLNKVIKPTRKQLTVEDLIQEQNYTPITKEAFYEKVEKLNRAFL